jgi:hypothetical protein
MSGVKSRKRQSWLYFFKDYMAGITISEAQAHYYAEKIDDLLHDQWQLGQNLVLLWAVEGETLLLLVVHHWQLAEKTADEGEKAWISELVAGPKHVPAAQLCEGAERFGVVPVRIALGFDPLQTLGVPFFSALVRRYSVSLVRDRAVALFDIVDFGLCSPLEQVTLLNSLSYSVNSAYSKLLGRAIEIAFARTTTGDGFYIWNRNSSIQGNVDLYHFVQLILADNAIARRKAHGTTTPLLRASFHVGSHYEFYQEEGLSPTTFSYIVGDVTIALARMVDKALPGQILIGDFNLPMHGEDGETIAPVDTIAFIERTRQTLDDLDGLELSGDTIDAIRCYLTGPEHGDGSYGVSRYCILDKHGLSHTVYNAKVNIHRRHDTPIYLGIREADLGNFDAKCLGEV